MNVALLREFARLESKQQFDAPELSERVPSLHRIKDLRGPGFMAKIRVWGAMTENLNRQPDLLQHQTARSRLSLSFSSHAKLSPIVCSLMESFRWWFIEFLLPSFHYNNCPFLLADVIGPQAPE